VNELSTQRVIAIVGRPNVGKSSIFNRLIRRRVAIVHEQRGVTRDRLVHPCEWDGDCFDVVDTGGLGQLDVPDASQSVSYGEIELGVRQQIDTAIEDAAVILFVTDIQAGIVPQDENVADHLRGCVRPVFLVANKADNALRETGAAEFERFGFPIFPVSALQNRGFDALMAEVIGTLPPATNPTVGHPLNVVVVGRPNVGKSSFVNGALHKERVIVSDIPGTTRDSIDIPFVLGQGPGARHYLLTDTAGIRKKGKIDTLVERFSLDRTEKSIGKADVAIVLIDAVQGPTAMDKTIVSMVMEANKGCVLAVNKWDLMRDHTTEKKYREALARAIPYLGFVPVEFISAKTGHGLKAVFDRVDHVARQIDSDLPTGVLNRVILRAVEKVQPPYVLNKRFKVFYAVQTGRRPVTVRLFVNYPDILPAAYEQYLLARLREAFGLEGAPIRLVLKRRSDRNV